MIGVYFKFDLICIGMRPLGNQMKFEPPTGGSTLVPQQTPFRTVKSLDERHGFMIVVPSLSNARRGFSR